MVRGLYTAATGAIVAQTNVDIIANNLANVNTAGFKRTLMQAEAMLELPINRDQTDPGTSGANRTPGVPRSTPIGKLGFGAEVYDTPTVFEQGPIQSTGNMMDVALSGPGFFSVRDKSGVIRYTRGGSFTQNAQNQLVTTDGDSVLGVDGQPVNLKQQGNISVDLQGRVSQNGQLAGSLAVVAIKIDPRGGVTSNGIQTGKLGVYEFADMTQLRPIGNDKFINAGSAPKVATSTSVLQGAQEKSNSNVISSMVDLITNERWFDANEKMIQTQDTELGAAITTVGKSTS